ncbi:Uncharacterised protein [Mycobacteroides abscessus subsp. abscessus]|nr:Uncharacterised protein [Mycobacteroides abscessus subsp. abscessus]
MRKREILLCIIGKTSLIYPRNKLYSAFNRKTSAYFPLPVTRFMTKHFTKKGVSPKDPHLMHDGELYQKSWRLYINKDFGIPNKETRQFWRVPHFIYQLRCQSHYQIGTHFKKSSSKRNPLSPSIFFDYRVGTIILYQIICHQHLQDLVRYNLFHLISHQVLQCRYPHLDVPLLMLLHLLEQQLGT